MKVVFLGTGGTYPSKIRNVTSIAVQMPGEVLMFDCGEGTQRQLMRSSVSFMKIKKIFVSHLHADHFLGIPGLVQSMSLNGREDELLIYGPRGMAATVESMMNLGYFKSGFRVTATDLPAKATLDFDGYFVRTEEAAHSVPCLAYSIEEKPRRGRFSLAKAKRLKIPEGPLYRQLQEGSSVKIRGRTIRPGQVVGPKRPGRKMVYSGDTRPSRKIVVFAKGADVLIHDCTLDSSHKDLAAGFGHSTAAQAADIARRAGVKKLFLVHVSPRYERTDILEKEARRTFRESVVATDLSEFSVKFEH